MKKIIGIVPASQIGNPEESCMQDFYRLGNNYIKRATEAGLVPIGLAPADNRIPEEALEMCDGFLVQGGSEFYYYHFQVIHHAVTRGKRYLGICLGEQLIHAYFTLRGIVEEQGYEGDLVEAIYGFLRNRPRGFSTLLSVEGHRMPRPERGKEDTAKHDVRVVPGTILHRLLGRDTMRLCSFHNKATPPEQTLLTVNAWSEDGVVEGTEYSDHILGIQGHPEADGLLPEIFSFLAE